MVPGEFDGIAQHYWFSLRPRSLRISTKSFAKLFAAAVLWQDRGPVPATDQQVAAFAWLEGAAVAGKETASLVAVHNGFLNSSVVDAT